MHVGGGRRRGGQKGDRMLIANISFSGLPKSRYRFWCLQLCSSFELCETVLACSRLAFGASAAQ